MAAAAASYPRRPTRRASARHTPPRADILWQKPIDNTGVVRVRDPREGAAFLRWMLYGVLAVSAGLGYVWTRYAVVQSGYEIAALKAQRERLREEQRVLRREEAALRSPERVADFARQAGLLPPQDGQLVRLEPAPGGDSGPVLARRAD
jgi:cell division protein FtsL